MHQKETSLLERRKLKMKQRQISKKIIELGQTVSDLFTHLDGTLTHWNFYSNGNEFYLFVPVGLSETGETFEGFWITPDRIAETCSQPAKLKYDKVSFADTLGKEITHMPSGMHGPAESVELHVNGCLHYYIISKRPKESNGKLTYRRDFDIRDLRGEAIPCEDDKAKKESKKKNPSPCSHHGPAH